MERLAHPNMHKYENVKIQEDFQKRLITNATDEEGVTRYIWTMVFKATNVAKLGFYPITFHNTNLTPLPPLPPHTQK